MDDGEDGVGIAVDAVGLDGGADGGLAEDELCEVVEVEDVGIALEELGEQALYGLVVDGGVGIEKIEIDIDQRLLAMGEQRAVTVEDGTHDIGRRGIVVVVVGRLFTLGHGARAPRILANLQRRPALISGGLVSGGLLLALASTIHADSAPVAPDEMRDMPLSALVRSYAVYTMCSIPALVDNSPRLLQLASLPGIRSIAEAFVRVTFFDQFVGGDTAHATLPLLYKLRAANKGTLFAYSVEVDEAEATSAATTKSAQPHPTKRIVDEMIRCIDVAADFEDGLDSTSMTGRQTWVAIKMSALLPDAHALINLSTHVLATRPSPTPARPYIPFPGCPHPSDLQVLALHPDAPSHDAPLTLTPADLASLRTLHADLTRICAHARARGVRLIFDAEYSWYQPAIDAFVAGLMRVFNRLEEGGGGRRQVQPLVYGTYQAYLRRTPAHLAQSLEDAKEGGYALGVKLVRGAYHPYEIAAHAPLPSLSDQMQKPHKTSTSISISPDPAPPVWLTKPETDACYDACVRLVLGAVQADVSHTSTSTSAAGKRKEEGDGDKEEGDREGDREPRVGVLFGTHNWKSCEGVLGELVRLGLAREVPRDQGKDEDEEGRGRGRGVVLLPEAVTERVAVGQLYGMCDDLTNHLVNTTASRAPFVIKYVPYGALSEVMPYLSRRAIENRSVLGDGMAALERRRAAHEIRRRVRAWVGLGSDLGA
ncbi:hypothetical protein D9615_007235 [Tricholomella constricta]|uniref:Proline dehydrogenase n=1 Tax=Tricholomella constricta TaxID=117010 RepID=A0A8H5H555_9AGAR|nr:hypothetical protein D9615_007235 [Tricholomella constricta]